jgi:LuxR family quorum-sensing system transcriptional regulator CciR
MDAVTREMGFRHFARIHHEDLTTDRSDRIDVRGHPAAIAERFIGQVASLS